MAIYANNKKIDTSAGLILAIFLPFWVLAMTYVGQVPYRYPHPINSAQWQEQAHESIQRIHIQEILLIGGTLFLVGSTLFVYWARNRKQP